MEWKVKDQNQAGKQGWGLFNYKPCKLSRADCPHDGHGDIQRIDSAQRFVDDSEALAYVQGRADAGDKRAKLALTLAGEEL